MMRHLLAAAILVLPGQRLSAQDDSASVRWIRQTGMTVDVSGRAFRSLDAAFARARLIGVGESVHAVHQFMGFRLELLKDLVQRHQVTAVVLESGLPESIAVDDYVRGRSDSLDYESALDRDYAGVEEARQAIQWLREWNLGRGKSHPVDVYGADLANGGSSMLPALDRLRVVAANDASTLALIDSIRPVAASIAARWWRPAVQKYDSLTPDKKTWLADASARLVSRAGRWTGGTRDQRVWAERLALVVQQVEVMFRTGVFSAESPRDKAMASNTRWILDRLPKGERAILWAHNAHVQRVLIKGPVLPRSFPSMGYRLGKDLGNRYFAIGTAYGGPSIDSSTTAPPGSVDAAFGAIRATPFLLKLRGAPTGGEVGNWLRTERFMRYQNGFLVVPLASAFDAVVYFDRATRAAGAQ